jgi:hypothetical protein
MALYTIRVVGHVDAHWSDWFEGLTITNTASGVTVISGEIVDQAALHGTLNKVRNLNLTLISVTSLESRTGQPQTSPRQSSKKDPMPERRTTSETAPPRTDRPLRQILVFLGSTYAIAVAIALALPHAGITPLLSIAAPLLGFALTLAVAVSRVQRRAVLRPSDFIHDGDEAC